MTSPTPRPAWQTALFALAGGVWLAGAAAGLWWVWDYDNRPGTAGTPPATFPQGGVAPDSAVTLASDRPTLVLLAHPQCFCTEATLTELAEVLARADVHPKTYVLFMKPQGFPEGWTDTRLWRRAAALPGVIVLRDDEGQKAHRLGAETSGQIVLYDAHGALLFSGGITGSRGHAGDNPGRTAVVKFLNNQTPDRRTTSVFGCPLFGTES